jgi:hypothetical protein
LFRTRSFRTCAYYRYVLTKKGNRTVDFSIVKEGLSRYQYGLMGILLILSLIVTVFTVYQIALFVLLQIDLMQDLPVTKQPGLSLF